MPDGGACCLAGMAGADGSLAFLAMACTAVHGHSPKGRMLVAGRCCVCPDAITLSLRTAHPTRSLPYKFVSRNEIAAHLLRLTRCRQAERDTALSAYRNLKAMMTRLLQPDPQR